jgi:hypothetical protein
MTTTYSPQTPTETVFVSPDRILAADMDFVTKVISQRARSPRSGELMCFNCICGSHQLCQGCVCVCCE